MWSIMFALVTFNSIVVPQPSTFTYICLLIGSFGRPTVNVVSVYTPTVKVYCIFYRSSSPIRRTNQSNKHNITTNRVDSISSVGHVYY